MAVASAACHYGGNTYQLPITAIGETQPLETYYFRRLLRWPVRVSRMPMGLRKWPAVARS
jgi:hypothetical protein